MLSIKILSHRDTVPIFFVLFQEGVFVKTDVGLNIRTTIKKIFDVNDEFIENRISTILLDGKVVDDIDRARTKEGCVLGLSGAMPGLVGATLRTHSTYESFRKAITYTEEKGSYSIKEGIFVVKLFNILIFDLGQRLLKKGIIVYATQLKRVLEERKNTLDSIKIVLTDGTVVDPFFLKEGFTKDDKELIEIHLNDTEK
ncbi:MAG TPA: hypothetical protein PLW88_03205 [Syntrophorhabdaceae bacterium]|nr:hypothetical protein [Syntrophorhabdaceae bacterium]